MLREEYLLLVLDIQEIGCIASMHHMSILCKYVVVYGCTHLSVILSFIVRFCREALPLSLRRGKTSPHKV